MEFMELHQRKLLVLYNFPSCHFKFIVLYCSQKGWYQWTGENLTARTECRVRAMAFFMEWFQRRSAPRSWGIEQMNCVSEWVLFEDHTSLIPQKARLTIDDRSQAAEMTPDCMYRRMQQSGVISCDGSGERRFALTFFWHFFDIFRLIWYNIWKLRSCVLFSSRIT